MKKPDLILVGASVRAAAFSTLRAGWQPWCVDLFADADLQRCCAAERISMSGYPGEFIEKMAKAPHAPWLYTGGLENHPQVVEQLSKLRPLWGNDASVLRNVRDPEKMRQALQAHGLACPAVSKAKPRNDSGSRWLLKPLVSAGGMNIEVWPLDRSRAEIPQGYYLQSCLDGPSYSAVYVGNGQGAVLLGMTRQLVGEPWVHAGPFRYCGSIGPVEFSDESRSICEKIGTVLAAEFALRGLFGVDVILHEDVPYPVEVNPRYTASVEILEFALGIAALQIHGEIFEKSHTQINRPKPSPGTLAKPSPGKGRAGPLFAKGILFTPTDLTFPASGPWSQQQETPFDLWQVPAYADLPHPGSQIEAGHPILTFFVQGNDEPDCRQQLQQKAKELERIIRG